MYKLIKETEVLKEYGFEEQVGFKRNKDTMKWEKYLNNQFLNIKANLIIYKNKRVALYRRGAKFNNEFYKTLYNLIKDEVIEWSD